MVLSALVDLGAPLDGIRRCIQGLGLEGVCLDEAPAGEGGLVGRRVMVDAPHEHAHRHLGDILAILGRGALAARARARAESVFRRLAEAEGAVHGIPADHVHFHEVGAVDAIVDIAGSCHAMDELGVDAVEIGPLPIGHGTVSCAHGVLPLPAPATVELLKGFAVREVDECVELVTPTGAAILTTLAGMEGGGRHSERTLLRSGSGYGQRKLRTRPNLLRALLFEVGAQTAAASDECVVLESNVDDMTAELAGALFAALMEAGALDVFTTAVQMKKQRPAMMVTVLCAPEHRETMLDVLFKNSTTFGVREYPVRRTVLVRRHESVQTAFGPVRIKIGTWRQGDVTRSPEFEDCAAAAKVAGVPVRQVYEAALRADVR
jgi:uncharacterized protein (TIGR00299 family) protein